MGAFGTARKTWITFQNVAILLLISLALTPAFRMRFWNIGGEGQVLIGGLAAAACMICLAGQASERRGYSSDDCHQPGGRCHLGSDSGFLQGKMEYQ